MRQPPVFLRRGECSGLGCNGASAWIAVTNPVAGGLIRVMHRQQLTSMRRRMIGIMPSGPLKNP
jgi:hypothetical protein